MPIRAIVGPWLLWRRPSIGAVLWRRIGPGALVPPRPLQQGGTSPPTPGISEHYARELVEAPRCWPPLLTNVDVAEFRRSTREGI